MAALLLAGLLIHWSTGAALARDGDNVAAFSPYVLTPAPNYELAAGKAETILTDERRARSWTGSAAVGWYAKSPVVFQQALPSGQPIRRIEIGTFQGSRSEVGAPSNAFVYAGISGGAWVYLGDAGPSAGDTDGPKMLSLDFEPVDAVSVTIVMYRSAPYLILDEIRVIAASGKTKPALGQAVADVLSNAAQKRRAYSEQRSGLLPLGDPPSSRYAWPLAADVAQGARCLATSIEPWTESEPVDIARAKQHDAPMFNAVGGWLSGLIRVENASDEPIDVGFENLRGFGVAMPETFVAHYVLALDYRWRADVLVAKRSMKLPPRSMGLVVVRGRVMNSGSLRAALDIVCGEVRQRFEFTGRSREIASGDRPYGNTWAYLLGPLRRLQECGSRIHDDAWIDTAVVDAPALTPRDTRGDDAMLRSYLRSFSNARRMLLFMDLSGGGWTNDNGAELEKELESWWVWVLAAIRDEGYTGEVMFYPVDEATKVNLNRLNAAAAILHRIAPSVPVYATIENEDAIKGAQIDAAQYHDRILGQLPIRPSQSHVPQIYATKGSSKTLGLSSYYRRLAWLAFGHGWNGAGLWSMWESSGADKPEFGWSDFEGDERDFALAYSDQAGCPLPSRRLMAFQRGLEDFALLHACSGDDHSDRLRALARRTAQSAEWDAARRGGAAPVPAYDSSLARVFEDCKLGLE